MSANVIPRQRDALSARVTDFINGAVAQEAAIGLKQNTAAAMQSALAAATVAEQVAGQAESQLAQANAALRAADKAGLKQLTWCKLRLASPYGLRWNANWEAAGFPDRSTAVPRTMDPRYVLLGKLADFFTTHPELESESMEATAALCTAAHEALRVARRAVAAARAERVRAQRAREAAWRALRRRAIGLVKELRVLLAEDDPRWLLFGLNLPGRLDVPEPVAEVEVAPLALGTLEVQWPDARRATRYRVQVWVEGVDEDFRTVATRESPWALLEDFAPGQEVAVRVIAANAAGEAPPGPVGTALVG